MKTPEDEAFDELARKQGAWGSGFKAKRQMAADKLQEDLLNYGTSWEKDGERIDPMSVYKEPAQEPVAWMVIGNGKFGEYELGQVFVDYEGTNKYWVNRGYELVPVYTEPPQREWVGLTAEETSGFTQHEMTVVKYVSKVLQEKNSGT